MIASIATDGEARKAAMERDLERNWQQVVRALTGAEPDTLNLMHKAYWYGVTTGVAVFSRAIDGEY